MIEAKRLPYVIGPTGTALTVADLPSPETRRWTPIRKAEVIAAIRGDLLPLDAACERYSMSVEEFAQWEAHIDSHGLPGLRVTKLAAYR